MSGRQKKLSRKERSSHVSSERKSSRKNPKKRVENSSKKSNNHYPVQQGLFDRVSGQSGDSSSQAPVKAAQHGESSGLSSESPLERQLATSETTPPVKAAQHGESSDLSSKPPLERQLATSETVPPGEEAQYGESSDLSSKPSVEEAQNHGESSPLLGGGATAQGSSDEEMKTTPTEKTALQKVKAAAPYILVGAIVLIGLTVATAGFGAMGGWALALALISEIGFSASAIPLASVCFAGGGLGTAAVVGGGFCLFKKASENDTDSSEDPWLSFSEGDSLSY